jgi:hypothetical protein
VLTRAFDLESSAGQDAQDRHLLTPRRAFAELGRSGWLPVVENIEVMSSQVGMALSAQVYKVIALRLVLPAHSRLD